MSISLERPQIRHLDVDTREHGTVRIAFGEGETYENLYASLAQSIGHANSLHANYIFKTRSETLISFGNKYQKLLGDDGQLDKLNMEVGQYRGKDINQDGNLLYKIQVLTSAINQWSKDVEASVNAPKKQECVIQ